MNLFEKFYERLELMRRTGVSDGEGGITAGLETVRAVRAAVVTTTATSRTEADRAEAHTAYKLTAEPGTGLAFGDILRRGSGELLRVTSNAVKSPNPASFAFEQNEAEHWEANT